MLQSAPIIFIQSAFALRIALTAGTCPVCDTAPGGEHGSPAPQRDLLLPIVLVATVVNVLLLGALAIAVARVG